MDWSALVQDTDTDTGRDVLVQALSKLLEQDDTEPKGKDWDAWASDSALRRVASLLFGRPQGYATYADVCRRAHEQVAQPEAQCLLRLAVLNGLRRLPIAEQPSDMAMRFGNVEAAISRLPDSLRRVRLMSLRAYHLAVYADDVIGDYAMAARAHEASAQIATQMGDELGQAVSNFCATTARCCAALTEGVEADECLEGLRVAAEAFEHVSTAGVSTQDLQRWRLLNVPMQLLVMHFLARADNPQQYQHLAWLRSLAETAPELARSHEPLVFLVLAVEAYALAEFVGPRAAQWLVGESFRLAREMPQAPIYHATAHLLLARTAVADHETMRRYSRNAIAVGVPVVTAVAQRELDSLP